MDLKFRPDHSVYWQTKLDTGTVIYFHARDIRRERGYLYAEVAVYGNKARLGADDFAVKKNEDRRRLAKEAHGKLGDPDKAVYPHDYFKHDLDIFLEELPRFWEEDQFSLDRYEPGGEIPAMSFVMVPYLIEDAITIIYGPQGTGKSYLAKLIGLNVCGATNGFWPIPAPRPVLYVNLERPRRSMERRAKMLMGVLGITDPPCMDYLHAPGAHLPTIAPRLRAWHLEHANGCFILDSMSFTQVGSVNDDTTATKTISLLRSIGGTWVVLGHTPRGDTSHVIGSTLQDAGADVMVRLSSERVGSTNGLAMEVTKANDISFPKKYYLAFEFEKPDMEGRANLHCVRQANAQEFPELLLEGTGKTALEKLLSYLHEVSEATPEDASKATGVPYTKVSTLFNRRNEFVFVRREGHKKLYGLSLKDG